MEKTNEKLVEAIKMLNDIKKDITDDVLKNATKEELEKYIELTERIESKIEFLLNINS